MFRFLLSILLFFVPVCPAQQHVIERFEEVLANSPKRGATFDRVYAHYADIGQSAVFLQNCLLAVQNHPDNAGRWMLLGLVAERKHLIEQAVEAFNKAAELELDNYLPMFYLGEVLLNQRRMDESIDAFEQSHKRLGERANRTDLRAVLQTLALVYTRSGHFDRAIEIWNQLAVLFPNDPDILIQIAESLEFEGQLDTALEYYRRIITLTDDPFDRHQLSLSVADILIRQGADTAALTDLTSLLGTLDSESYLTESVLDRIDRIFSRNRDISRHIEFYHSRIKRHPADLASFRRLVQILRRADRNQEAEDLLLEAIRTSPGLAALRLILIDLLAERGDVLGAIEQFQAIDRIVPNSPEHLVRWGMLVISHPDLEESERRSEASEIWHRMALPGDSVALVQLADLFFRNRFFDEAEQYYKDALALRPDDFSYREHLARFYHQQGHHAGVLTALTAPFSEAQNQRTQNQRLQNQRTQNQRDYASRTADLLLELGYYAEASQMVRDAVSADPANWVLQSRYFEGLVRLDTPASLQSASEVFVTAAEQIASDEQFALFLQQSVQLLRALRKTDEMIALISGTNVFGLLKSATDRYYWQLAALHHAAGDFASAIAVLEQAGCRHPGGMDNQTEDALASPGGSMTAQRPFAHLAAELYAQTGRIDQAISLYQELIQSDPARSGNYWQHIITLQIQNGQLAQAVESIQNLIGYGAANARRFRFAADLLLSVYRYEEAILLLRQALVLEPGNIDILRILAQTLVHTQQHEEAIELFWRLYGRLDNFSAKLSVIEILAMEYAKLGRVEDLIEHLQNESRQMNASIAMRPQRDEYQKALARVYSLQGDDESAQYILESLLDTPNEMALHWVLRELVGLLERQEDWPTAILYQEMICRQSNEQRDQNHLFYLYDKVGDTVGMRTLFFDQILRQPNRERRQDLMDAMRRRGQDDAVDRVLDFLAMHEGQQPEGRQEEPQPNIVAQSPTAVPISELGRQHNSGDTVLPTRPLSITSETANDEAVDRLLNTRLGTRDLLNLVPILYQLDRHSEAQEILDRLTTAVSDRPMMGELFYTLIRTPGNSPNAVRLARRILITPTFMQNSRRFMADIYLMELAIQVLQEHDQFESVFPILEMRFRNLRNRTDSRILLAKLYIMLDRQDEARALALELSQTPTADPERRQVIISLLVHFDLRRELESMHRLHLEREF